MWSPKPYQAKTLTPALKFYVAVCDVGDGVLANWDAVFANSARIEVPSNVKHNQRQTEQGNGRSHQAWRRSRQRRMSPDDHRYNSPEPIGVPSLSLGD